MMVNREIAPHLRMAWPGLAATAAVTLLGAAASVAVAVSMAAAITEVLRGSGRVPVAALLAATGFLLLRALLLMGRDLLALETGSRVTRRVRRQLLEHVFRLGPAHPWHSGRAKIHLAVVDGCEHLRGYLGLYLPQALSAILIPAVLVLFLAQRSIEVALIVVVGVLVVPLANRVTHRLLGKRANEHWDAYTAYSSRVADSIAGLPTLAGLGAAQRRGEDLVSDAERLRKATTVNMNVSLSTYVVTSATMLLGTSGATVMAAWQAAHGQLAAADVVLVLFLAAECFRPLQDLQNYWHEGFYGLAAAAHTNQILATPPQVVSAPGAVPGRLSGPPAITLTGVHYRYPGADRDSLLGITAQLPAGATTALVGASGAGKSTLSSIILRDMDPSAGTVHLSTADGPVDVRELPLEQVRQWCARVDQEVVLLDETLLDNVLHAAPPGTTEDQVEQALQAARVTEFLPELPHGVHSAVGEGGANLSGGQRQRVAMARRWSRVPPCWCWTRPPAPWTGRTRR